LAPNSTSRRGIYKSDLVRRLVRWFDAIPHPPLALEIATDYVAGVRWSRNGQVEKFATAPLPTGVIVPSAVDANVLDTSLVGAAIADVCRRLDAREEDVALLLPDPVLRVFIQQFEDFPRSDLEAVPLLRWKIKKSIPFEVEETLVSYMRQPPRKDGVEVVVVLARHGIVREYESLVESAGLRPGVVQSSSMAAVALLADGEPSLMARVSGNTLTTAVVSDGLLCVYRCTEMSSNASELSPQVLMQELFPIAAYYQDTWGGEIKTLFLGGLGSRLQEFVPSLERELRCAVTPTLQPAASGTRFSEDMQPLLDGGFDGLIGWSLTRGTPALANNRGS